MEERDANFTLMRQDFIDKNPEAAAGWMKAEIEALRFLIDNPREIGQDDHERDHRLRREDRMGGAVRGRSGRYPVNYVAKLAFDAEVLAAMKEGYQFLHSDQGDRLAGDAEERDQPRAAGKGDEGDGRQGAARRDPRPAGRRVHAIDASTVVPAKAGTPFPLLFMTEFINWVPAFAGTTS